MRRYQNAHSPWSRGLQFQSTSAKYQHRTNPYSPTAGMLAQQPTGRHTFRRSCKTNSSQYMAESAVATAIFPDDLQESFQQGTLALFSSGQAVKKDVSKRSALMSLSISQNQDRMLEVLSTEPVVETSKWKCSDQDEQIKDDYMFTVFPRIYSRSQWKKRINNLKSIANVNTNKQKLPECADRTESDKVSDELLQDSTKEIEIDISAKHCLINSKSTVSQSKQILSQVNGVSDCKGITNEVKKDMAKHVIFTIKEDNESISKEIDSEVVSSGAWLNTRKYHEPSNINALTYSDNVGHMLESKVSASCARQNASQSVTMHVMVEQDKYTPCLKSEQPNTIHMENKFVSSVDHNEINIMRFQREDRASPVLDGQSEDMFPNTVEENQIPAFLENKSVINKYTISLKHENYISDAAENINDFPFLDEDELIYPSQNICSRRFSLGLVNNSKNGNISNVDIDADDMVYPSQEHSKCQFNKTIFPCQNQIKGESVTGSNFINSEAVVPSGKTQQSQRPNDAKVTIKVIFPCQDQIVNGEPAAGSHFTRDEAVFSLGKRQMVRKAEDSKPPSDEENNQENQQNSSQGNDDDAVPPSQNSDKTKLLKALPDIYKFIVPSLDTYALYDNNENLSLYSEEKTFLHKIKR
ncbi:hypothetical protein CHS0354_036458 [Potamilus streckersoni]|uniref:Uncharacterized protein n=1 Tax=Potamilus streckersoni TaxID=2493646 RepID=A0AAE0SWN3_9BIVA|nr:hypothetical protein CHS0354_036458 [Potamilus streckersoni]